MQGLGGTGQQHAEDCTFPAGHVAGAPLVISWFIVIFTISNIWDAVQKPQGFPMWMSVLKVIGNQFILYSSVLVHELGHGSMAKYLGGSIAKILLWPFGGICFSRHPQTDDGTQSLKNSLKIVAAGPATHFPQTTVWMLVLFAVEAMFEIKRFEPAWQYVIPFYPDPRVYMSRLHHGLFAILVYEWVKWGIFINVMSFVFNVFFPMYPMDCSQLMVCSLQLFCGVQARTAALVLICCAVPCAILILCMAVYNYFHGGPLAAITGYMGVMALADALKIWRLRNERRLHIHPLFMNARSRTRDVFDEFGSTRQLNTDDLDDEPPAAEMSTRRTAPHAPLTPFGGSGYVLSTGASAAKDEKPSSTSSTASGSAANGASSAARSSWLDKLEKNTADKALTVREMEDQRLEREGLHRQGLDDDRE
mmetsp:Transcript_26401/g.61496  ORF Transcript_26401/g.61496 Transcript_26401/m.61496 type:complete len:420 (+) Transcript_26401:76-1335(+)